MPKGQPPFQAFTVTYGGLSNVLSSAVGICAAYDPERTREEQRPPFVQFDGIWDTGATASVIRDAVVTRCGLKPVGMTLVRHAQGESQAETYMVNVRLPNGVGFHSVRVTRGVLVGCDALIGMDIINQGDFAVTNVDRRTVFSFRVPSLARVDYVQQWKANIPARRSEVEVDRNDPCPCGSGKKYKKCCGKNRR